MFAFDASRNSEIRFGPNWLRLTGPPRPGVERANPHPILVNWPIVVTPKGVKLCRPSEVVFDLLERRPPPPSRRKMAKSSSSAS